MRNCEERSSLKRQEEEVNKLNKLINCSVLRTINLKLETLQTATNKNLALKTLNGELRTKKPHIFENTNLSYYLTLMHNQFLCWCVVTY